MITEEDLAELEHWAARCAAATGASALDDVRMQTILDLIDQHRENVSVGDAIKAALEDLHALLAREQQPHVHELVTWTCNQPLEHLIATIERKALMEGATLQAVVPGTHQASRLAIPGQQQATAALLLFFRRPATPQEVAVQDQFLARHRAADPAQRPPA